MNCRHCNAHLEHVFLDLANCPPSNAMLKKEQLRLPEIYYPLKIYVCSHCFLVQLNEVKKANEIFDQDYTYFSSYSKSLLAHSRQYVDMMMQRFGYNGQSLVVELASNDGYLLQYFKQHQVQVLGIDPTKNTARAAKEKGIDTLVDFFGADLAKTQLVEKGMKADLIIGNNVLAHVPDINDFVAGMKLALKPQGCITMEFPHFLRLVEDCLFDTIYHEHYSYLSFITVKGIFEKQGLEVFDVEEIATQGGSLRIFAKHQEDGSKPITENVQILHKREENAGLQDLAYYKNFQHRVDQIKYETWQFLIEQKKAGKKVVGYGAAAKAATLLNYCGIKGNDLIEFIVDLSPHKQQKYLAGSHIPVVEEDEIKALKPDVIIIFPWNIKQEIMQQLSYIREWNGSFVVFVPVIRRYQA